MESWADAIEQFDEYLNNAGIVIIDGLEYSPADVLKRFSPGTYGPSLKVFIDAEGVDSDDLTGGHTDDYRHAWAD